VCHNISKHEEPVIAHLAQSWPQKRKTIIIAKYMEDSVVKSVDILLKDNLIRNLKKKRQPRCPPLLKIENLTKNHLKMISETAGSNGPKLW
jgi:hypothetical protein